jgi:DNA-binding PadR family transcriptional regulator
MDPYPPFKPAALHILLALLDGDSHGYGIMQSVRARSGGQIALGTGSFYRHLAKLIDAGFVTEIDTRRPPDDPRRGVHYRLTPRGRQALAAEKRRLADLIAAMERLSPASRKGSA